MQQLALIGNVVLVILGMVGALLLQILEFVATWAYRLRWYLFLTVISGALVGSLALLVKDADATYTEASVSPVFMSMYSGIALAAAVMAYAHYSRGWLREEKLEDLETLYWD